MAGGKPLGGLPPHLVAEMTDFTVPSTLRATYSKLHKKYSQPSPANTLRVKIGPGGNKQDIVIP